MSKLKSIIRNATIAAATLVVLAAPIAAPSAHAGGKSKVNFHLHIGSGGPFYGSNYGYAGYYGYRNPCSWLKHRWLRTGSPKWHWRYKECMLRYY